MKLRNVRLTLANIAPTTNARSLVANEVAEIKERDMDGNPTDKVIGYSITCVARRDTITIKFENLDVKPECERLKKLLEDDFLVEISLEGLRLVPFALKTATGDILSGVSAKAQSFKIVKNEKDEFLDAEIDYS